MDQAFIKKAGRSDVSHCVSESDGVCGGGGCNHARKCRAEFNGGCPAGDTDSVHPEYVSGQSLPVWAILGHTVLGQRGQGYIK